MKALEETLRKGEVPQEVRSEECQVVFQSLGEIGRARKFQVSASTVELLSRCDGTRGLGDIVASLKADWETVLEATTKLLRLGLLEEVVAG
jgi:hypothetical protein